MTKNAIIFVDANNWYHNIKKYFNPGDVDITKFGEFICKIKDYKLKEIRWYASLPNIEDGERNYYKHMAFLSHLEKKSVKVITRKLQRLSNRELQEKQKNTIESLDLCDVCKPIVNSTFLDLSNFKRKEKGIDVWIAVDIIRKSIIEKECEVCLLISGDADFIPALNLIKKQRIEILTAMTSLGYSSELRRNFPYFILRKLTLMKCFRSYKDAKA